MAISLPLANGTKTTMAILRGPQLPLNGFCVKAIAMANKNHSMVAIVLSLRRSASGSLPAAVLQTGTALLRLVNYEADEGGRGVS
jgi:hypothetical protein